MKRFLTSDQLRRSSFSIMLNVADCNSCFSIMGRNSFFLIARGRAFKCLVIMEYLNETKEITQLVSQESKKNLEEISKMLYGLIKI